MKNLFKKLLVFLAVLGTVSLVNSTITANKTNAADDCRYFLGLTSWDCNTGLTTEGSKSEKDIKDGVIVAGMNIITDISVTAAYLVLGYVIYGGYLYIFSAGDPGKVSNGKKTLTQAFIGLAIVMSASVIFNAIRIALGANFTGNCAIEGTCNVDAGKMVTDLINWVIGIAGVISAIFAVYGGISYMTASGDPGRAQKARQVILYAIIGLIIVALSASITAFVSNIIRENTSYINNTIIAKEVK